MKLLNDKKGIFTVFVSPKGEREVVKQGWSWPGFFFSCIWAMVKKMWGLGVGLFICFFVLGFAIGVADGGAGGDALINLLSFIVNIIFGINGNSWREKNLISRGFEQIDTVSAANPEGAMALCLKAANA